MNHTLYIKGELKEWDGKSFRDTSGILHQANIASLWTEAERKAVGLYPIVETDIPEGKISTGYTLVYDEVLDTVTRVRTLADKPVYVPQVVSRFQAKAALANAGLLTQVETMMQDPATDLIARLAWQDATEFHRDSPTILAMATSLNLTETDLDALFINASSITA